MSSFCLLIDSTSKLAAVWSHSRQLVTFPDKNLFLLIGPHPILCASVPRTAIINPANCIFSISSCAAYGGIHASFVEVGTGVYFSLTASACQSVFILHFFVFWLPHNNGLNFCLDIHELHFYHLSHSFYTIYSTVYPASTCLVSFMVSLLLLRNSYLTPSMQIHCHHADIS
jgi:hypothetical protein